MSNVASKELALELFNLTNTENYWDGWRTDACIVDRNNEMVDPMLDLGYLLRKLPMFQRYAAKHIDGEVEKNSGRLTITFADNGQRVATYVNDEGEWIEPYYADTPEDAAAKLAIQLFKEEVL